MLLTPAAGIDLSGLEAVVSTATGPFGLVLIFSYSVLVAFVLPLPGELVLLPAPAMNLGVSAEVSIAIVIVVSAIGKALGSVAALRLGRTATTSRPARWLVRRVFPDHDPETPPGRMASFAQRHGYIGMAVLLAIPLTPDTATVYAFSVLDTDERLFAVAAFLGTIARLLISLVLAAGVLATL